jgi:hypothetical protein
LVKSKRSFRIVRYFKLKDKGLTFVGLFIETRIKEIHLHLKTTAFTALIVTNRNGVDNLQDDVGYL